MELTHRAAHTGRLLEFLKRELGLSSTQIKRLKLEQGILVSGVPAHTDRLIRTGEEIRVLLREPPPAYPPEPAPLAILYEDGAILAVDKSPALWVHPTPSRMTGTLANQIAFHLKGEPCAVHVVTRLDRDTFGVVLIAKYAHFHALLGRALQQGKIQKTYLAAVSGAPPRPEGTVDLPIARRPGGSLLREPRPDGQPALTRYRVLSSEGGASLLELRPETGRTHQLRVHCAALGCPILGDCAYGTPASLALSETLKITTQQLCAKALSFPHPLTGEILSLSSRQNPIFPKLTVEPGGN